MPRINFPNIPSLPGVPNLKRSAVALATATGIINTLQKYDVFGVLSGLLGGTWDIADSNGNTVLQPDSYISISHKREFRISSAPVEMGSFTSYNKVSTPYDFRVVCTCNGSGSMTRDAFLSKVDAMVASTDLYTITTPDATYQNANLVHYDYQRTARNGVQLLTVDLWFQEVRVTATRTLDSAKNASGNEPVNNGTVTPNDPTATQTGQYRGMR